MRTAVILLVAAACAHSTPGAHIERDAPWRHISSPHFVLYTDESEDAAREALTELERNYAVLEALKEFTFATRPGPEERVNVVLFRRSEDFHAVTSGPANRDGVNMERDGETFVVVHSPVHATLLNHELVHGFVRHYLWRAPTWLNEGLAEFYSNFRIEKDHVTFGLYPQRLIRRTRFPPLRSLLSATPQQFYDDPTHTNDYYAESAMLVHMLNCDNAEDRARFGAYIASLGQGVPADQAWQTSFGNVSVEALDHRLRAYLGQRMFNAWRTSYTPPPVQMGEQRIMRDFEVRLLWVQITDWNEPSAKSWIAAQLRTAQVNWPAEEGVLYWSGRYAQRFGSREEAKRLFAQAALAEPDRGRTWMALAGIELAELDRVPRAERQPGPALEHLRQLARTADQLNEVAWYLSRLGRPTEALPFAVRAIEKAPGCYYCRDTMAALFFQKGALARAIEEQRLAVNLVPERAAETRRRYLEVLTRYEKAVAAPPAAPPSPEASPED